MPGGNGGGLPADKFDSNSNNDGTCDQVSCYVNCRTSLQGGGQCKDSECKCYPKDGTKRPEDNTWFELSEQDQARIVDIENRFEAIPAVMTTSWLDITSTLKPARRNPTTTVPTTTPSTTTTTTAKEQ
eukprot:TRINITY_DN8977_c0_g1_i1.p1 TRINITY_DN8977_c0_g1~~TRINITY_DN8977_c0_g1_i1.p1  ORF type:complete len:128 (+),score=31.51 TRINITY_DN8977_c0_g1_i1:256-639(+)